MIFGKEEKALRAAVDDSKNEASRWQREYNRISDVRDTTYALSSHRTKAEGDVVGR